MMNQAIRCTEITAAVTRSKGAPFTIEAARIRQPQGSEVLVCVVATGLCHTDIIVRDQYYPVPLPAVLGHEGAGIVESVGPNVKTIRPGDHVVLTCGACGHCDSCAEGHGSYRQHFFGLNFGGARRRSRMPMVSRCMTISLPSRRSRPTRSLRKTMRSKCREAPLDILDPLGCGIQTGAGAVINSLKLTPGASFVSFGNRSQRLFGLWR